jgi:hypothetical protein
VPNAFIRAELGALDLERAAGVILQVKRGYGGFLIFCRIDRRCFLGGLDGRFDLEVLSVTRVKPLALAANGFGRRDGLQASA